MACAMATPAKQCIDRRLVYGVVNRQLSMGAAEKAGLRQQILSLPPAVVDYGECHWETNAIPGSDVTCNAECGNSVDLYEFPQFLEFDVCPFCGRKIVYEE